jgi:catechol 2,3-dioxygenase-like lactoylglutathione lyase family enzyme
VSTFRVLGISWAGIGTDKYEENLALFRDVLGLPVEHQAEDQVILRAGDQQLEIFGRDGPRKHRNTPPTYAF